MTSVQTRTRTNVKAKCRWQLPTSTRTVNCAVYEVRYLLIWASVNFILRSVDNSCKPRGGYFFQCYQYFFRYSDWKGLPCLSCTDVIHGCVVRAGCSLWSTFGRNSLRANYRSLEETARRKEVTIMGDMNAREGCETRREEKKNLEKIQRLSTPRAVLMCQMFELNININVCIV